MMKPLFLTFAILTAVTALTVTTQAQSTDTTKTSVQQEDYDKIFTKTEIEPAFPGGPQAWKRYLHKNLDVSDVDQSGIPCTVVVRFIVNTDGKVTDVQAISGPTTGGFREEAVRVIKNSGRWTPAIQNGRQVKCFNKIPITF